MNLPLVTFDGMTLSLAETRKECEGVMGLENGPIHWLGKRLPMPHFSSNVFCTYSARRTVQEFPCNLDNAIGVLL